MLVLAITSQFGSSSKAEEAKAVAAAIEKGNALLDEGRTDVATSAYADQHKEAGAQKYALKLIAALDAAKPADRVTAAEQLGLADGPNVLAVLRQRAATEKEERCRLALLYAMGLHGDIEVVRQLGDHARDETCMRYLCALTGRNEWNAEQWHKWLAGVGNGKLANIVASSRSDLQWEEYARCHASQYFHSLRQEKDPDPLKTEFLCSLPHARAWGLFSSAAHTLAWDGDRAKAASLLSELVAKYPNAHHAKEAAELRDLLRGMVEEDRRWKEPGNVERLDVAEKVRYYVYHLRDVHEEQWSQPGEVEVLGASYHLLKVFAELDRQVREASGNKGSKADKGSPKSEPSKPDEPKNAACHLLEIGEPAVPALVGLLDDRRPIRSVGHWRDFWPERTVLRYQDAAIEILDELLPAPFYNRSSTGSYVSNESDEKRTNVIASVRAWYKESAGKSKVEQKWNAVKYAGIHSAVVLLKSLAVDDGQRDKVLAELHRRYEKNHWVYRPRYAELLAELGDTSKVAEVLDDYRSGKYERQLIDRPDDSGASLNSRDAAERLMKKYGPPKKTADNDKH
ncbi:MAG: hypothetical protein ABSG86_25295 [Thermoguttaceae bacterium]